jgi:hypothetical protein
MLDEGRQPMAIYSVLGARGTGEWYGRQSTIQAQI